jgi:hypothetical protein
VQPWGGRWAWVLSKVILLKCRTNVDRYSSAGVGGLCVGILALCKVGFVSGFCVPCNVLKIAWDSMAKSWVFNNVRNAEIGLHTTSVCLKTTVAFSNIVQFKSVVFWSAIDFQQPG